MTADTAMVVSKDSSIVTTPSFRAWIESGILYHEYVGEISAGAVLDNQQYSLQLMQQQKISVMPVIVILKDIDKTRFKLHMSEYSKVISSLGFIKRVSDIWLVGAQGEIKSIGSLMNKVFFDNRMHLVSSLEQAKKEAHAINAKRVPILEKQGLQEG